MAFELPDLPYAHDALADSGMSKETLEFHHDLHHKAYVDNGNKLADYFARRSERARRCSIFASSSLVCCNLSSNSRVAATRSGISRVSLAFSSASSRNTWCLPATAASAAAAA